MQVDQIQLRGLSVRPADKDIARVEIAEENIFVMEPAHQPAERAVELPALLGRKGSGEQKFIKCNGRGKRGRDQAAFAQQAKGPLFSYSKGRCRGKTFLFKPQQVAPFRDGF